MPAMAMLHVCCNMQAMIKAIPAASRRHLIHWPQVFKNQEIPES
jgi:hypothetical protein